MQDKFLWFAMLVVLMECVGRNKAWQSFGAKQNKTTFIIFMIAFYLGAFVLVNERAPF